MYKFKGVDIIDTLRKITQNNTLFYQTDFDYDAEQLKEAEPMNGNYLWLSRGSGTWLFDERDVYIRNTNAYNTWQYFTDSEYYGVKAFSVVVTSNHDNRPFGNIYELHYNKHIAEVQQNSFVARTVDVTFKPTHWESGSTRTFDVVEYNDNWRAILDRYGEAESVRYNLTDEDENRLAEVLDGFRTLRDESATPENVNKYIAEMVTSRFHGYGYTQDDMEFTTPEDAANAVKFGIPVYALRADNTKELIADKKEISDHTYSGGMFGMGGRDKQLLGFMAAGNSFADLLFNRDELKAIFFMALEKGKDNVTDDKDRRTIDNIIHVLEKTLFDKGSELDFTQERDNELDDGMEQ